MTELFKKAENISNGLVDIIRCLENKDSVKNYTTTPLLYVAMNITSMVRRIENDSGVAEREEARRNVRSEIDTGKRVIDTLIFNKIITEKEAASVLNDLQSLCEIVGAEAEGGG